MFVCSPTPKTKYCPPLSTPPFCIPSTPVPTPAVTAYGGGYQTAAETIAAGDGIPWIAGPANSNVVVTTGSTTIGVTLAGVYRVYFQYTSDVASQFTLQINGANVPGATAFITPDGISAVDIIVPIAAGSTLEVVNTGIAPVALVSGGIAPALGNTALITLQRIG